MGRRSSASDVESGVFVIQPTAQHFAPPPPQPWVAWIVPSIFIADVAIFCYTMYVNDCPAVSGAENCFLYADLGRYSFQPLRENPLIGPTTATLDRLGGLERRQVVELGQTWRLFSCMWLHAGVIHLLVNMFSLLCIGVRLEEEFGFIKISILYVLSGIGGSLLSVLSLKSAIGTVSVGASGALFGLLGAMLSELLTNWTIYSNKCSALSNMIFIIGLNVLVGMIPGVDNSAHTGGFCGGFFLGFVLLMRPQYGYVSSRYIPSGYDVSQKKRKYKTYQYIFFVIGLIGFVVGYKEGFSLLSQNQTVRMPF